METKVELLAPSKDQEGMMAAISNGADAVYLGVDKFNARIKAPNFKLDQLKQTARLAHLYNTKVYLTLNTSIKQSELTEALQVVEIAKEAKVDAIIITDLGLIKEIRTTMPDIVLHGSTQIGVHNLEGALIAQKIGLKRVVLSREVRPSDVRKIKQNTDLEIEAFVHGALCVCFSGQCYLSSIIGGNSGNRGLCAQPCRQHYASYAADGTKLNDGYLLSASDMCCLPDLQRMIDDGVCSFKIEGRLRRVEYAAQVVKTYSQALKNGKYSDSDIVDLKKVFNRGDYKKAYDFNKDTIYQYVQGHIGDKVGEVVGATKGKIKVKTSTELNVDDAFKLIKNNVEVGSATGVGLKKLGNNVYELQANGTLDIGSELRITTDGKQMAALKTQLDKLPLDIQLKIQPNYPIELILSCKSKSVKYSSDFIVQNAITAPVAKEQIISSISKLNDTPFCVGKIDIAMTGECFVTPSQINAVRRNGIDLIIAALTD